eukprot:CAMPEP_0203761418 /NCGR_PEP_ID=MMETSP0098-20131031/14505_1 /ASSEMBLY_ACC=CAM_ASM_000208 /TAXON_ID=96639 /ORGANISM=" , Strain NY0313808BC1" /LENGTH=310 /DNA_ID=CAMNT_0050655405 /DNA_START=1723 /DNA_END=2655 /DNA_ORIENTATION=-
MNASGVLASSVEVTLDRVDRTYHEGDTVRGVVKIKTHHMSMSYSDVSLVVEGATRLHLNAKNVGLLEAFYSSIEPQVMFYKEINLDRQGKVSNAEKVFPFEFVLEHQKSNSRVQIQKFFETYHGVYINNSYIIKAEVTRGMLSTNLVRELEFLVQVPSGRVLKKDPVAFTISNETLSNVQKQYMQRVPKFKVTGKLDRRNCQITEPLTGELVVEQSEVPIRSIELQLARLESIEYAEGVAQEATEVQNIQIGDGDVCRQMMLPLYVVFPRLITCPTMLTDRFRVEFEITLVILFKDGTVVTEMFPIVLTR